MPRTICSLLLVCTLLLAVRYDHALAAAEPTPTAPIQPTAANQPTAAAQPPAAKLPPAASKPVDYARDVQPLLARCIRCHGSEKRESGLALNSKVDALAGGDNGAVIKPGDSEHSRLIRLVAGMDPERMMPPADDGDPLSAEQIGLLRGWIDAGAAWPDKSSTLKSISSHWSYQKPVRPQLPKVSDPAWCKNEIDRFILARLDQEKLRPTAELDRPRLLRRLSLDLTGLPPTPDEVAAYVADTSPDAYEKQVDRLLASPHYGERFARPWLDLARYADTDGYEKDPRRTMWPYRDWLIAALNDDLPFDQFTIEQLAGDQLPNATQSQRIATGFHRNTMINTEGGVDREEYRTAAVIDRVNTTATVWLGTTLACCRCHSHKYDPFKQKEYFQFYAYFNSTADSGGASPQAEVELPGAATLRDEVAQQEHALETASQAAEAQLTEEAVAWEAGLDDAAKKKLTKPIQKLLAKPDAHRSQQQRAEVMAFYRTIAPRLEPQRKLLAEKKAALARHVVKSMVMQELPKPRTTHIHLAGNFLSQGDAVLPAIPAVFGKPPEDQPVSRLSLARWLVDGENPLTARVTVNRAWEQLFGQGLVLTSEDFGTRGDRPSHPELLDWLACELPARKWSMKALHRLMVTSATYRQSAKTSPGLLERDPYNRLLARGPRFRLEAEMVRDQALTVCGLLSAKIGGPSVMPPQPDGVWSSPYSGDKWQTSASDDKYRRGLYTFWRRTAPYPAFMSFDAPSREICIVRRVRSNTPLQALTVLNDPVYVEAAQALARRMMTEAPGDSAPADRIRRGFQLCVSREPTPAELGRLLSLHAQELARFQYDRTATEQMLKDAPPTRPGVAALDRSEWAAWTVLANVLLNLDEMITRG